MIVLREFRMFERLIGLNPSGELEKIAVQIVYLALLISTELLLLIFFISNIQRDIYRALGSLPSIIAFTAHMVAYLHLLIGRERFFALYDDLQNIVDESMNKN